MKLTKAFSPTAVDLKHIISVNLCCSCVQVYAWNSTVIPHQWAQVHGANFEARRRLRSASSLSLNVRHTRLTTIGNRTFPVAAAHTWNSLPNMLCLYPLWLFSLRLPQGFPPRLHNCDFRHNFCSDCAVTVVTFGHLNRSLYLLTYLPQHHPKWSHKTSRLQRSVGGMLLLCLLVKPYGSEMAWAMSLGGCQSDRSMWQHIDWWADVSSAGLVMSPRLSFSME